ncbi:MAG: excinuclease ABC subunit UvrA [Candidatus Muirbacterium halophilum]|nr:excinuclease ABC subunit UvrA [Candidatus Muirbacterium halophilum]MCK9474990.1 excinuclease ABC subunit UvrA [Candidatus Muirbacterium halophilum]
MLSVKGAREHNLKNINVDIPRNQLTVITGLSGSGKSSLAFDTIYGEGQRRYVESLSNYARQFLGIMKKPDVDQIEGLSPAIVIEQRGYSHNPRSTVGTITEIYDYFRLFFARIGKVFCPDCDIVIESQHKQDILRQIKNMPDDKKLIVMAPLVRGKKGGHKKLFENAVKEGVLRVKVNGEIYRIDDVPELDKNKKHSIYAVVDRVKNLKDNAERLSDSVELALKMGDGLIIIEDHDSGVETLFSEHFSCSECGYSIGELSPRFFSFNSPYGACPDCEGIGFRKVLELSLMIDKDISIGKNPFLPFKSKSSQGYYNGLLNSVIKAYKVDPEKKFFELSSYEQNIFLNGTDKKIEIEINSSKFKKDVWKRFGIVEGFAKRLERLYNDTDSDESRKKLEKFMTLQKCNSCNGARLNKSALSVRVNGLNISEIASKSIIDAKNFIDNIKLSENETIISSQIFREIKSRLFFLNNVGLGYLTLDRLAYTLSGGEYQRIRLATQLGTGLVGVLYVLDEPSIGLHQKDNQKLLSTLFGLRDMGNTVLVVEHDEDTIRKADYVVDMGPGAGKHGGEVVFSGNVKNLLKCKTSITAKYLNGIKTVDIDKGERSKEKEFIELKGASGNNLKNINIKIPTGKFTVVTGVSGSGKSTLINDTLYPILMKKFHGSFVFPLEYKEMKLPLGIKKVIMIDQMPIGRTPRSNPATYTGLFTEIRDIMTKTKEAKKRGYKAGRFSFNVKGGRCEVCEGQGIKKIEMQFLPDVYVECEECKGARYNEETLQIKYKGKNIADILNMTIEEALEFFEFHTGISRKLATLNDVGLSYMHLGQPATTLSGGEAQRVKLATELSRVSSGDTIYMLDEPTTGLHFDDVNKLLSVLDRLVARKNTVIVIEHNIDVIKFADYIIDLGLDGGEGGGNLLYQGSLKGIKKVKNSYTSEFL